jgi:hypothetical protein
MVAAHPGHELVVHHWLERHEPLCFFLTDGSGGDAASRLDSSRRLLRAAGAREGSLFGRWPDRQLYQWLLEGHYEAFLAMRDELAAALTAADVEMVIGDAMEGFNPLHDLCRALIDGTVAEIRRRTGRIVANYAYALDVFADEADGGGVRADGDRGGELRLVLDHEALERKLAAATAYPEMRVEVEAALGRFGAAAFSTEVLRPAGAQPRLEAFALRTPHYETIGAQRVGEARYAEVIRYREHVLPALSAVAGP